MAVWTVFVLPFAVLSEFSVEIVALYWFPAVVLTLVGAVAPPWKPLTA